MAAHVTVDGEDILEVGMDDKRGSDVPMSQATFWKSRSKTAPKLMSAEEERKQKHTLSNHRLFPSLRKLAQGQKVQSVQVVQNAPKKKHWMGTGESHPVPFRLRNVEESQSQTQTQTTRNASTTPADDAEVKEEQSSSRTQPRKGKQLGRGKSKKNQRAPPPFRPTNPHEARRMLQAHPEWLGDPHVDQHKVEAMLSRPDGTTGKPWRASSTQPHTVAGPFLTSGNDDPNVQRLKTETRRLRHDLEALVPERLVTRDSKQ